jgi:hypothetical protein
MSSAIEDLPNDIETLKAMLIARDRTIEEIKKKLTWAEEKYRAMEMRYFGRKSEHYSPEEDKQNRLFDEAEEHSSETAPPALLKIHVPAHDRSKRGRKPKRACKKFCVNGYTTPRSEYGYYQGNPGRVAEGLQRAG